MKSKQETRSYDHHTMIDNAMYYQKCNETFFCWGKIKNLTFRDFFGEKQTFLRESRPYFHNFEKKVRYLTKSAKIRPSWRHCTRVQCSKICNFPFYSVGTESLYSKISPNSYDIMLKFGDMLANIFGRNC